ncbi:hypothetical protein LZ518_11625 [Sphingomonas sp. RB56-2]|uniref:Uncharacterized protein n=1 Tax=Sphingomonas brevis TaxID=2908206 RepID=A0ABT0SBI1_9SPHN|nr:hypothetical protein [Sphingomonas brevis]MCL6741776.1 hypothetical protein [Sphingomonas brevis]
MDTNVAIVANARSDPDDPNPPSIECRLATVTFLMELLSDGKILLDLDSAIQTEYRTYLNPRGQPGVGDRFYQAVLQSAPERVERVELPKAASGEYADFPQSLIDAGFDPSDRKFAALARREGVPVYNATDSDWIEHAETLAAEHIQVEHLCGCNPAQWFAA